MTWPNACSACGRGTEWVVCMRIHLFPALSTGRQCYPLVSTGFHWYPLVSTGFHRYPQ